ncbi:MAG TPA: tyrosine-type recombinase/integrase [Anaeromyxobacteraceae bacterium]|nr:tyrosine-type recombinase/integrase [Anaeromyxobacteraceae bacterium]
MSPATVGHCLRLLSRLYSDLVRSAPESGVFANPLRTLDPSVRRRCTPPPHAKRIPFIESPADVDRVMNALAEPYATMFAVGVHAGLRPGEVKALAWPDIDLGRRSIAVSRQVVRGALGPVMRGARRVVPIFDALAPILASWRTGSSGGGFAFRSVALTRGGRRKTDVPLVSNDHTLLLHLDRALQKLAMKRLTWHEATRHTFACHFVRKGGSLERLAAILGHSRAWTVKRYAELAPDAPVEVKANSPAPVGAWSERDAVGGEVALSDMREEERERIAML